MTHASQAFAAHALLASDDRTAQVARRLLPHPAKTKWRTEPCPDKTRFRIPLVISRKSVPTLGNFSFFECTTK